jgi:hypothetical protein
MKQAIRERIQTAPPVIRRGRPPKSEYPTGPCRDIRTARSVVRTAAEERKRKRYRKDEDYRQRHIASAKANQAALLSNPVGRELHKARCQVYNIRESIDRLLLHVERREKDLMAILQRKESLERRWREARR